MAVTLRNDAKNEIMRILREQGYPTYAKLVSFFDIFLTNDPNVVGYMVPDKAIIVLNENLSIKQVSTIVRHEILHEFLEHQMRRQKWETESGKVGDHELANIAADYEISNKGYTDSDKINARSIFLNGQVLRGLVTEDQHPDWENKSFEEMYAELLKEREKDQQQLSDLLKQISKVNQKDLEDLEKALEDMSGETSKDSNNGGDGSGSDSSSNQGDNDDDSGDDGGGGEQTPDQKKASKLADEVEDINKELNGNDSSSPSNKDNKSKKGGSGNVFDSQKEQNKKLDRAKRVEEIKRIFSDIKSKHQIDSENRGAISREKAAKAARDVTRVTSSPLSQFKLSLDRFVTNQIASEEEEDYSRQNPSYEEDDFFEPDIVVRESKFIPKINVYWDVSGSFNDPHKTEGARKAISTLNRYIRDESIEVDYFYFATKVSTTISGAGGSTNGKPIQDHIAQTNPDNVIIITDGDISDCSSTTIVPGAVWVLFYESQSQNLIDHIKGKKETRHYLITEW